MAELEFNIKANFDEVTKARQEMNRLREELLKTTKATDPIIVQDLTDKYAEQKRKVSELNAAMGRYAVVMSSEYSKKMQNLTREVYNFELQADASKRNIEKLSSEIAKMQSRLRKGGLDIGTESVLKRDLGEKSTILGDEKRRLENITGLGKQARTELQNMQAEYIRYSGSSTAATDNIKNMTDAFAIMIGEMKKVPTVGEGASSLLSRIGGDAKSLAMSLVGGLGFEQLAEHVFNVRSQFQQLEISFTTMLGSEQKAGALMSQLIETAAKTPFDMGSITQGAKQLLAYGTAANEVNDILIHLGDISAGLSVPLGDLVYLYGTTMAQGRMYTMDLRQFMGRGIPMAEELGKIMGKTTAEVQQAVTDGKVGADLVKKAIMNMSAEGGKFGGLMEKQSKTLQGKWSNIGDSIDQMFNSMGKKSEGIFGWGLDQISALVDNWETVVKVIGTAAVAVGTYKAGLMAAVSIQKAQNEATIKSITSRLDAQVEAYKAQSTLFRSATGKDTDEYKKGRLQELNTAIGNTDMIGNKQAEELVSLKIKEAQTDGLITQQMAEQLQLKRDMLVAQSQSTAKDQMEALELSKGLDAKMAQFKEMENDYRHLNGKDTKEYRANRYSELGDALTDTENIGDSITEERIANQIKLAQSEGLISEEMAKQLQLKRDLLVEQSKLAEKEQAEWQNAVNTKEAEEDRIRAKKSQEQDIARINAEAALTEKIEKANDTDYGKALLKTHELEKQLPLQQELCDKLSDETKAKKEVLINLDEQIRKQKELLEQKEKEIVYDNGAVDTTSFGGYEDSFSNNENDAIAQYEAEQAKLEELMQKRSQAAAEFENANNRRKSAQQDLEDVTERLSEAQEHEIEVYKETGAVADDIADTVQQGIDIQEGKTTITEAATAASQSNTIAEGANTTSKKANTIATEGQTVADATNTTAETTNTVAKNTNTTSENLNTGAKSKNTLATSLHTAGTKLATLAETAFNYTLEAVTTSLKGLWATMLANPITGVITLVTTAISIFSMFGDTEEDLASKTSNLKNKASEASEKVRSLFAILGENKDADKHKDTINALKSVYEEYGVKLDETKMKNESLAVQAQELIDKKEELIGVIEEQTIAMEHQNQVQAAYDEYNSNKDKAKEDFKEGTEGILTSEQAGIATTLIRQEDLDLMQQYREQLKGLDKNSKEYQETSAKLKNVHKDIINTLNNYYQGLNLTDKQIDKLKYRTEALLVKYEAAHHILQDRLEDGDKAREAAEKASDATAKLTFKEEAQAAKTRALNKTFKDLNSDIRNTISLCSKTLNFDIKVNYDDSQLPVWIKKMSDKQLKSSMAIRDAWLKKHKKGDFLNIGGQLKSYEQVATELGMMSAAGSNRESKQEETEKEKEKKRKAAERARAKAEREANERETRKGNIRKAGEDYDKTISDYSIKAEEDVIKRRTELIKNETDKEIAQINLSADKEKKAIEDSIAKLVEAKKKKDQTIWVNEKKGRKASMWKQTKTDEEYRNEVTSTEIKDKEGKSTGKTIAQNAEDRIAMVEQQRQIKLKQIQQAELKDMLDFMKEYGNLEQQRYAIIKEYTAKIDEANLKGDTFGAATAQMQLDEQLKKLDFSNFKDSINWDSVFQDLEKLSVPYLEDLRKKLKELQNSGTLDIQDMKVVSDKIHEIDDAVIKQKDNWGLTNEALVQHKRLLEEAAEAQERLNIAQGTLSMAKFEQNQKQNEIQAVLGKANISENKENITSKEKDRILNNAKMNLPTQEFEKLKKLFDELAVSEVKVGKATKEVNKAQSENEEAQDKASNNLRDAAEIAANALGKVGDKLHQMQDIVNALGLGNTGFGKTLNNVTQGVDSATGAASAFASGNYIGAAIQGISAVKSFGKALGIGGGDEKKVNEKLEKLAKSNEILTDSINRLTEEISKTSGVKAIEKTDKALELQQKKEDNLKEAMQTRMGYDSAHHSFNYYWNTPSIKNRLKGQKGKLSEEQIARASKAMGREWSGDLHDIKTAEEANALLQDEEIVNIIRSTGKGGYGEAVYQRLKEWADEAGKQEEMLQNLYDSLTQTSFDSMRSSFISTLMDMKADGKDFSNDFSKMLMQSVLSARIDNELNDRLKAFYDKWGKLSKAKNGQLSKDDISALKEEYNGIVQDGLKIRDEVAAVTGYKESYEQSVSSGAFEGMSQETGDELNGRFTAVQIATEGTYNVVQEINQKLSMMLGLSEEDEDKPTNDDITKVEASDTNKEKLEEPYKDKIISRFDNLYDAKLDFEGSSADMLEAVNEQRRLMGEHSLEYESGMNTDEIVAMMDKYRENQIGNTEDASIAPELPNVSSIKEKFDELANSISQIGNTEDASIAPELPILSHPINNSDSILNANFDALANSTSQMFLAYDEGRTILAQSLMYLQSIDERQEKWHKPMLQAFNRIGRIADKVERL